ncbi:sensor histidine kinase [Paenibacillus cremeus]|uniref:Sensor histidine kinase n=1 Tax=Paenibacillus cremeus TaxID=2163881 RepID=A0A559JHP2_9BACL|nr:sensor histidine kinase [Paenibacillus cremeus]TVX99391.1 sensor histidine kinase [Paenibacillus cremeus]
MGKMKILERALSWANLKNYKIEHKLVLTYPPLIALSILVVSTFCIMLSIDLFREKSISYSENILKQISFNIDTQLSRIDQDTMIFYQNHDVTDYFASKMDSSSSDYFQFLRKLQEFLTNFLISHQNVESIYLINNEGEVVSTSSDILNYESPKFYNEKALEGDGRMVWLETKTSSMGNNVIPAVRQIVNTTTMKGTGSILVNFKETSISDLLQKDYIGKKVTMVVINRTGDVISSQDKNQLGEKINPQMLENIKAQGKDEGYFFQKEGSERVYYNFYQSSFTQWIYLYRIPSTDLFSGYEKVQHWMLVVAAFFIIVGVLCSRYIAYHISKPIIRIIREMRSIETNNLLVNLNYDGKDELTSLASSFNSMMDRLRLVIKKESDLQRMKHELEIRAMQAEINPHFLYNTLEAINWIGRMNNIPKICDMTTMLAEIMRYSISNRQDLVRLEEELAHVKRYLNIQKIRFEDKLSILIDVDEALHHILIPKLTLQPMVENAVVHGLADKDGVGRIRISGRSQEDRAVLMVEDNGCGMPEEKVNALLSNQQDEYRIRQSIGIKNVDSRLRLFFGEPYGLQFKSVVGRGTRVTIHLPMNQGGNQDAGRVDRGR